MNSAATFLPMLQVIVALSIFVAVYLALVLCTITCLVAAELISEGARVVRDYGVRHADHLASASMSPFR